MLPLRPTTCPTFIITWGDSTPNTPRFYEQTQDSVFKIEHPSAYACQECCRPHDNKDCTKVKKVVLAWNSNMLSNHSNKGRSNSKGGRENGNKRNTRQGYKGHQTGAPIQPYQPYQQPHKEAHFKRPYPNRFQSHTLRQTQHNPTELLECTSIMNNRYPTP